MLEYFFLLMLMTDWMEREEFPNGSSKLQTISSQGIPQVTSWKKSFFRCNSSRGREMSVKSGVSLESEELNHSWIMLRGAFGTWGENMREKSRRRREEAEKVQQIQHEREGSSPWVECWNLHYITWYNSSSPRVSVAILASSFGTFGTTWIKSKDLFFDVMKHGTDHDHGTQSRQLIWSSSSWSSAAGISSYLIFKGKGENYNMRGAGRLDSCWLDSIGILTVVVSSCIIRSSVQRPLPRGSW